MKTGASLVQPILPLLMLAEFKPWEFGLKKTVDNLELCIEYCLGDCCIAVFDIENDYNALEDRKRCFTTEEVTSACEYFLKKYFVKRKNNGV